MNPNQKKVKPWKPAKEFRVIRLPREEPPSSSELIQEYIGEVNQKGRRRWNGEPREEE